MARKKKVGPRRKDVVRNKKKKKKNDPEVVLKREGRVFQTVCSKPSGVICSPLEKGKKRALIFLAERK